MKLDDKLRAILEGPHTNKPWWNVDELEQAILEWVNEVIGEDARHHNGKKMVNPDFTCPDCGSWDEGFVQNKLRAEQRKRAGL